MTGVGVDIEDISRFKSITNLDRFLTFVFSASEIDEAHRAPDMVRHIASRFSLKEAVIKAVPEALTYHDIEIVKVNDKPTVKWRHPELNKFNIHVSLSHSPTTVIGFAVIE